MKEDRMRRTNRNRRKKDTVYVVGYARLPDGTTAKHVYSILGLGIELEKESGKILEVSCTTLPPHGSEVLRKIFVGKSLEKDFDNITEEIRSRYIDRTRGALLAAIEDLLKRFNEAKKQNSR
jgi:hypothetical protein